MFEKQELLIALGSNLTSDIGGPAPTLTAAMVAFRTCGMRLRRISRFFRTPCYPQGAGPDYVNACAVVETELAPKQVLENLHVLESGFGRERTARWASRTLDLDLLAAGASLLPDAETQAAWMAKPPAEQMRAAPSDLILPHPRLHERAFVLVPLCDVAASWVHPVLQRTAAQLRDALPRKELDQIKPL